MDPVVAEDLRGQSPSSSAGMPREVEATWVITTWFMISSKTVSSPRASLSAITATTPISGVNPKASVTAAAAARAPCGLCAASSTTGGRAADQLHPPGNRHLREALPGDVRIAGP